MNPGKQHRSQTAEPSPPREMPSMTDACRRASREPHFFKVLLPNFSTHLLLPRGFVKVHICREDEKAGSATISSPDGKTWNVSLDKKQEDTYLSGDEWRACTEALNLKVGYFLVFSYKGSMVFSFKVFDLSACEKAYPVPPLCSQLQPIPVSAKAVAAPAAKTNRTCKAAHLFEIAAQHGNGGSITSICKMCNCTRFETRLSPTSLYGLMRIPVPFVQFSGLSKEHERLILRDLKGRSWPINLGRSLDKKAKLGITTRMNGWRQFSLDNQLELGDRCVFDLEAGEKHMMHVQVFKA